MFYWHIYRKLNGAWKENTPNCPYHIPFWPTSSCILHTPILIYRSCATRVVYAICMPLERALRQAKQWREREGGGKRERKTNYINCLQAHSPYSSRKTTPPTSHRSCLISKHIFLSVSQTLPLSLCLFVLPLPPCCLIWMNSIVNFSNFERLLQLVYFCSQTAAPILSSCS